MPVAFPNSFANGDTVDWDLIEENLAEYRTWLNAIPLADIPTASLNRETIARPVLAGWPVSGLVGDLRSHVFETFGREGGPRGFEESWGVRAERVTIRGTPDTEGPWLTKIGRTLDLHDGWDHDVHVMVSGTVQLRLPSDGSWSYPTGGGTSDDVAGRIKLYRRSHTGAVLVPFPDTQVEVFCTFLNALGTVANQRLWSEAFHTLYYERLTGGQVYDIILGYEDLTDGAAQVDLSELTLSVEVS